MGAVYCGIALFLGGVFVKKAWKLLRSPSDYATARSLFKYSILYMMLLCAGMALDSLPVTRQLTALLSDSLQTLVGMIPSLF
jgi:protoheme IX farnesyltransferase